MGDGRSPTPERTWVPRANRYTRLRTGCSAVWLARRVWVAEAAGSNPASPTKLGRAAQPLTAGQHTEQRPDRFGDRLQRFVVRQLKIRGRRYPGGARLADRV